VTPPDKSKLPLNEYLSKIPPYTLECPQEDHNIHFLNRNENFFVTKEMQSDILNLATQVKDLRLYEQPYNMKFLEEIAAFHNTSPDYIFAGNGSDEIIYLLPRVVMNSTTNGILPNPSFSPYTSAIRSVDAEVRYVTLSGNFDLPIQEFRAVTDIKSTLTFLAMPNNPTGNLFDEKVILEILKEFPGIVVVDEAYGPLAGFSFEQYLSKFRNLVILRSFSKVFGAAGIRVGYCLADPQIIDALRLITQPYNLNALTQAIASKILQRYKEYEKINEEIRKENQVWFEEIKSIPGVVPYPSKTNFILFQTPIDSDYVFKELLKKNIVVRKQNIPQGKNFLRVTIAPQPIREIFMIALRQTIENYGGK
jgi:histidinol-phosphate aminotransferase